MILCVLMHAFILLESLTVTIFHSWLVLPSIYVNYFIIVYHLFLVGMWVKCVHLKGKKKNKEKHLHGVDSPLDKVKYLFVLHARVVVKPLDGSSGGQD